MPQEVWHGIASLAPPTASTHCGTGLQEFHCPLPLGSVALHCNNSTAHRPQVVWQRIAAVLPPAYRRQCGRALKRLHCTEALWWCIAVVPPPMAPKKCGGALQEFHYPLPTNDVGVHCKSSMAHCP